MSDSRGQLFGVRRVLGGVVAACVVIVSTPAAADGPGQDQPAPLPSVDEAGGEADPDLRDPMIEARKAYERGRELYDAAEYEEALGSFLDAQRLYASPDHHFNIARCYEALERYQLAVEYYRAYLRSDPADKANIKNKIARLEQTIAAQKSAPTEPAAQPDPTPPPTQPASDEGPRPPGQGMIIGGAVLTGLGAALALGGGIGAGVVARDRSDRVDAVFAGNPEGLTRSETSALDDEGRRFETIQIATAAVGGAVAVAGIVLIALGVRKNKRAPAASAFIGRQSAGVAVRGRF